MIQSTATVEELQKRPVAAVSRKVWVDLDNTPHVPFFLPIIRELRQAGHRVVVTARDAFQVCDLVRYHGLECTMVGRHYGRNKLLKVAGTVWRAAQLLPVAMREKPDVSMSHGSRSLILASAALGIPTMLLFDYEHARTLPFLRPALGVAPKSIQDPRLARHFRHGIRSYEGLKEDVYAVSFHPDPSILTELGVSEEEILVTIRPPATEAHYHNPAAEALFVEVVNSLGRKPGVRMIILPRTAGPQADLVRRTWPGWCADGTIVIPRHAVDGLNLVWFSDLVVSGGGTMNREAAALGVPVYSIFRGRLGAVDRYLASAGRLVLVEDVEDVRLKIRAVKRARRPAAANGDRCALQQILAATYELMEFSNDGR